MAKTLKIELGVLAPPLYEQLNNQGLNYDCDTIQRFETDRRALNQLRIRELIPESQLTKGYQKLFKRITEHVKTRV